MGKSGVIRAFKDLHLKSRTSRRHTWPLKGSSQVQFAEASYKVDACSQYPNLLSLKLDQRYKKQFPWETSENWCFRCQLKIPGTTNFLTAPRHHLEAQKRKRKNERNISRFQPIFKLQSGRLKFELRNLFVLDFFFPSLSSVMPVNPLLTSLPSFFFLRSMEDKLQRKKNVWEQWFLT